MIESESAKPRQRAVAKVADTILLGSFTCFLVGTLVAWDLRSGGWEPEETSTATTGQVSGFLFLFLAPVVFVVVQTAFLSTLGATPGKLFWGLRVATAGGGRPGVWRSLWRTLSEFISLPFFGAGYIGAWTDPSRQTWHDDFSGTTVLASPPDRPRVGSRWSPRALGIASALLVIALGLGIQGLAPWIQSRLRPEAERYVLIGNRAFSSGAYSEALSAFTKAIAADPKYSLAYANRGSVYGNIGDLEHQIADCTTAIRLDSTQVWALLGRGNAYRVQGRFAESSEDYSRVILLRPDWSGLTFAYLGRGVAFFHEGRFAESASDFQNGAVAGESYHLGTSDYEKDDRYRGDIAKCRLFRCEALRKMGSVAAADSEWARSREVVATTLGGERAREEITREWLYK